MSKELTTLQRFGTWDMVPLPPHKFPLVVVGFTRSRLVPMATTKRYKACFVTQALTQKYGFNYETFSQVAKAMIWLSRVCQRLIPATIWNKGLWSSLQCFLRIEVAYGSHRYLLFQQKYTIDLTSRVALTNDTTTDIPMQEIRKLMPDMGEPLAKPTCYHEMVRSPVYLTISGRILPTLCMLLINLFMLPHLFIMLNLFRLFAICEAPLP